MRFPKHWLYPLRSDPRNATLAFFARSILIAEIIFLVPGVAFLFSPPPNISVGLRSPLGVGFAGAVLFLFAMAGLRGALASQRRGLPIALFLLNAVLLAAFAAFWVYLASLA